jgi:predicted nuclease of predicted toxin-antitoxin system
MKLLFDMNLSPLLALLLRNIGWETIHWSTVGDPGATDRTIMEWARKNGYCVVTNDLDFGAILAATDAECPSVVQIRTHDVSPSHIKPILINVLQQYKNHLEDGALVSVDERRARVRLLPLKTSKGE